MSLTLPDFFPSVCVSKVAVGVQFNVVWEVRVEVHEILKAVYIFLETVGMEMNICKWVYAPLHLSPPSSLASLVAGV